MNKANNILIVSDEWKIDKEEKEHEVKHPLYMECYLTGLKCIFQRAAELEEWKKKNENRVIVDERSNIFSFVGRRGSGKTTAMDEFCRILREIGKKKENYEWWLNKAMNKVEYEDLSNKSFRFHILNPIDASLFGEQDDLFEQVIVNIYNYFQNGYEDYFENHRQKLMQQFSDIMKRYYGSRGGNESKTSDFSIANMMNFSSDNQTIQTKITKLIDKLLECEKQADFEYLVITIDDLDLNISKGYQMVEQIQRYFAYHKIIVLISIDYEQMNAVSDEHFYEVYDEYTKYQGNNAQKLIRDLSRDVMTKMFHLSQRIYMPDFERLLKNVYVIFDNDYINKEKISVKSYILSKIAGHMYIYYDICGQKKHFAEPSNIREFVVYNEFLETMEYVDFSECKAWLYQKNVNNKLCEKNENVLKKYDLNYKKFLNDILQRMAQDVLTAEQRRAFRRLILCPQERRAKYFINLRRKENDIVFGDIDGETMGDVSQLIEIWKSKYAEKEYSYGLLLERIYMWGRESRNDYFRDKAFISCVLASFTTEMTRNYLHYYYNPDDKRRTDKYEKRLLGMLGISFGSKWFGESFPRFQILKKNNKYEVSALRGYADAQASLIVVNLEETGLGEKHFWDWVRENQIVEILEILSMLFSYVEDGKVKYLDFELQGKDAGKNTLNQPQSYIRKVDREQFKQNKNSSVPVHITGKGDEKIQFDVMTFVLRSLNYDKSEEQIINTIVQVLREIEEKYWGYERKNKNQLDECKKRVKDSLQFSNRRIREKRQVAFPFYNLDFSYNVCKRLRNKFKNAKAENSFLQSLKKYYEEIGDILEREQKEYTENYEKLERENEIYAKYQKGFNYFKNYTECPFIKGILDTNDDENKTKILWGKIERIIDNMTAKTDMENEAGKMASDEGKTE